MRRRLSHTLATALAVAGVGLLGTSVQGVADMDRELRSSVRTLPVNQPHDCPLKDRTTRGPEV